MKDIGNGYFATEDGEIWSKKTNKYLRKRHIVIFPKINLSFRDTKR